MDLQQTNKPHRLKTAGPKAKKKGSVEIIKKKPKKSDSDGEGSSSDNGANCTRAKSKGKVNCSERRRLRFKCT